jgi:hypothetical protein
MRNQLEASKSQDEPIRYSIVMRTTNQKRDFYRAVNVQSGFFKWARTHKMEVEQIEFVQKPR